MKILNSIKIFIILIFILFIIGCGAIKQKRNNSFAELYKAGKYKEAIYLAEGGAKYPKDIEDVPLWGAKLGLVYAANGEYIKSNEYFDYVEQCYKDIDTESTVQNIAEGAGAALVTESMFDYEPRQCDKIFINTYKALNYLALGDAQAARVELNRAYDRQRRAVELFKEDIKDIQSQLAKKKRQSKREKNGYDYDKIINTACAEAQEKTIPRGADWSAYADFINPYPTYLAALFRIFCAEDMGDLEKASFHLRRLQGMIKGNVYVQQDLDMVEKLLQNRKYIDSMPDTVWIIIENGLAPKLEQFRLDIPLFLLGKNERVKTASIAIPKLKLQNGGYSYLNIGNEYKISKTSRIADIDAVFTREFKILLPSVIIQEVISTVGKTAIQYEASKLGEKLGGDLGANILGSIASVYSVATTEADTRSLDILPKNIQIARIAIHKSRKIEIKDEYGNLIYALQVPKGKFNFIYIDLQKRGTPPIVNIMPINKYNHI